MAIAKLSHLGSLKLKELEIFYLAAKTKSIREVSRRLESTPGQISKAIQGIERKMQVTLFSRSASGIVLTESGAQLIPFTEAILDNAYKMESIHRSDQKKIITVAATPFLISHLVAEGVVPALAAQSHYNLRLLDINPDQTVLSGFRGAYDVAFHFSKLDWPLTWHSVKIGAVEWVLCARQSHPLKKNSNKAEILKYPFIQPTYWTSEGLSSGNDFFEIPIGKRLRGYETSTANAALPLLLASDHLACLPTLLIQPLVKQKALKIIDVAGLKGTSRDLYISVKGEALSASLFERLKGSVTQLLDEHHAQMKHASQ